MENNPDAEYPFTGDEKYDKLVKSFYIFRGVAFAILFILNSFQTYFEFRYLRKKGKGPTPRLMTFLAISLFPFCRTIQSFLALGLKDSRTGSPSWYLGIYGTLFLSMEWLYIGCFWARLLYTFFARKKVALGNLKKTWYSAHAILILLFIWNFILIAIINTKSRTFTASVSAKGFISLVALIGSFLVLNGFFLIRNLRSQDKKSNAFQKTISRTLRLSCILLFIVLGIIIREIVVAITKIGVSSNYRYAAILVTFVLEYPQCLVVMVALADDGTHWKNYFSFKKVAKDSQSSGSTIHENSSGNSGGSRQNGSHYEIDLSSVVVDNDSSSKKPKVVERQPTVNSISLSITTNDDNNLIQSNQMNNEVENNEI